MLNEQEVSAAQALGEACAAGCHVWAVNSGLTSATAVMKIDETPDGATFEATGPDGLRMLVTVSCQPVNDATARQDAMAARVRQILNGAGFAEYRQRLTSAGQQVASSFGFTVKATSGTAALVTFQGTPPPSRPARDFLAAYTITLQDAGMTADARSDAGYVTVRQQDK